MQKIKENTAFEKIPEISKKIEEVKITSFYMSGHFYRPWCKIVSAKQARFLFKFPPATLLIAATAVLILDRTSVRITLAAWARIVRLDFLVLSLNRFLWT